MPSYYASTTRVPWKESNLALIGTDLDHKIKLAAAQGEEQWQGLEKPEQGTYIWRMEDFRVVPWPREQYGQFYEGDSYLVLHVYQAQPDSDTLSYDLHLWIGSQSSQDEYGTGAYKMVEADEVLRGAAIQHREVQGHESDLFRSYFSHGQLTYLAGGVDSGFNHVTSKPDEPHLYKIKGTEKGMSLTQVVPLAKSSLNTGDSFILFVNKSTVFCWHGASANPDEKARANSTAENMCTQGTVVTLDQDQPADDADAEAAFWQVLGTDGDIAPADDQDEQVPEFAPLLYKVRPDSSVELVATGEPVHVKFGRPAPRLARSLLVETDVFLLDAGWELFVWTGAQAERSEKLAALEAGQVYSRQQPRTADVPLTLVKTGYENSAFSGYFIDDE